MNARPTLPEKRTDVLFSRITKSNKNFVVKMSEERDVSEAVFVDWLITRYRKLDARAGNAKKSRRSA